MNLNPLAVVFWAILFLIGYLVSGMHAALVCLLVGMVLSLLIGIFIQ